MPARATAAVREMRAIAATLRKLTQSFDRLAVAIPRLGTAAPAKRKLTISPERRVALKLQGQYMGYMRQLKQPEKVKVKGVRAAKGIRAAITTAKRLASE